MPLSDHELDEFTNGLEQIEEYSRNLDNYCIDWAQSLDNAIKHNDCDQIITALARLLAAFVIDKNGREGITRISKETIKLLENRLFHLVRMCRSQGDSACGHTSLQALINLATSVREGLVSGTADTVAGSGTAKLHLHQSQKFNNNYRKWSRASSNGRMATETLDLLVAIFPEHSQDEFDALIETYYEHVLKQNYFHNYVDIAY